MSKLTIVLVHCLVMISFVSAQNSDNTRNNDKSSLRGFSERKQEGLWGDEAETRVLHQVIDYSFYHI
jgi:hypothetical protein